MEGAIPMDFYHSWIYQKVMNTEWFLWIIFYTLLAINVLFPLIVWYVMNGKKIIKKYREKKQNPADAQLSEKKN